MRQLFRFMFHHASHLTFGAMLMAMSSFGQTYFVSLYGQDFREAFGLTDGGLGGLYAIGTVMSAITLTWAGRLIDYTTTAASRWRSPFCCSRPACWFPAHRRRGCCASGFTFCASAARD